MDAGGIHNQEGKLASVSPDGLNSISTRSLFKSTQGTFCGPAWARRSSYKLEGSVNPLPVSTLRRRTGSESVGLLVFRATSHQQRGKGLSNVADIDPSRLQFIKWLRVQVFVHLTEACLFVLFSF